MIMKVKNEEEDKGENEGKLWKIWKTLMWKLNVSV